MCLIVLIKKIIDRFKNENTRISFAQVCYKNGDKKKKVKGQIAACESHVGPIPFQVVE